MSESIWIWADSGLYQTLEEEKDFDGFFGLDWDYFLLTLPRYDNDERFKILIQAENKENALAVAYQYLADEGEDFRLEEPPDITKLSKIHHHLAQTQKIDNPNKVISECTRTLMEAT